MKNLVYVLIFALTSCALQSMETRDNALLRGMWHIIIAKLTGLQSSWENLNIHPKARLKLNTLNHTLITHDVEGFRDTQDMIDYVASELQDLRRMPISPDPRVERSVYDDIMDLYDDVIERDLD